MIESVFCSKKHVQQVPFKIYNASAGSGKTYTLAKEYLKIVLSSHKSYKQILAITFTNKAVNEMKERILGNLFHFTQTPISKKSIDMFNEICQELQLDAPDLRQKSKVALKEILHNYSFFDVSTIDKFTHRLIRTFAHDLKLPQNFEVVLDTDLLLAEAVERLIARAGSDTKLTKVLIDFAIEKIDDNKSWDVAFDLNQIGLLLFNENHSRHLKNLENKGLGDFLELKKFVRTQIEFFEGEMITDATKALLSIEENGLEYSDFTASYFPKFMLRIKKKDLKIDFNAAWKQNFAVNNLYNKTCAASKKSLLDGLQSEFIVLFDQLKENHNALLFLKNIYTNVVPLTVLNAIQNEVKTIQKERDQLSISEFNSIISEEIKNQPAPFIYERLGEKYRHYFIDEFQDTSIMQWDNLIPLVGNALESEDNHGNMGSLLLVGDAKQAIYRWRGGKAEQFLNLVNSKTNPFVTAPQIKNLPKNYRSHKVIVDFNNDFFMTTTPFLNNETYQTLFLEGNRQEQNSNLGGFVQLNFIEQSEAKEKDEIYCNEVLKIINSLLGKNFVPCDITILVRNNRHGILLADYLTQNDITVISADSLLINSSEKVRFLVQLLLHSSQPGDLETNFNILGFLGNEKENKHDFIHGNLYKLDQLLAQDYDFEVGRLKQMSVYDGLEYALRQFDLAKDQDAYIINFMDVVYEVEQKEGTAIQTFLSYWEKKKDRLGIAAPQNIDAIQIMSVHKAKGLEFPIVIFPFANAHIYKEINPKLWLPVERESFKGFDEVLINKKREVLNYSATAMEIYEEEQQKLELDAYNVLYVALTRAIKALYIISEKDLTKAGEHNTDYYSGLFIHYLKEKGIWQDGQPSYSFGKLRANAFERPEKTQQNISYQYTNKERSSFTILASAESIWDPEIETARVRGNLIHDILGMIENEKDAENAIANLKQNRAIAKVEAAYVEEKVNQVLAHPKLKKYYSSTLKVFNERDILTKAGRLLRPDRIVIDNSRVTIIDYKTGKRNSTYSEQLYTYADALENMGYEIEEKIIVYIDETITPEFI